MFDRQGNRKYLNWPERETYFREVKKDSDPLRRAFCLTLFYTGCRISEALKLTPDRIDFTERALVFETMKQRRRGQFRSIPIPDALVELFERILGERPPDASVWPYSRTTGYRLIKQKMADASIAGVKACPKGLRHSFAIACISRGIPLTTVKKWLGHARLETTAIYLDAGGDEERELAKKLWRSV